MSKIKVVDSDYSVFDHPMSGYMESYNTLKVVMEIHELKNGKFVAYVEEQMFCGDEEDEGLFAEHDKSIRDTHDSDEFNTQEEAWNWIETNESIDYDPE